MNQGPRTEYEHLSPDEAARIDATCDRFERAWKAAHAGGITPRIARYVDGCNEPERTVLIRELIAVDRAYRRRFGRSIQTEDYAELGLADSAQWSSATDIGVSGSGEFLAQPADWPRLPGLELLEVLGAGGMGVVYKARQPALDRTVAVKLLRDAHLAGSAQRERFLQEARAVARLQHPNLVQVYELGEVATAGDRSSQPYLVLEYVAGGSLSERLRGTPQPPREAARLVETLAEAIHYAHRQGVIHRDLKPGNVLLVSGGVVSAEWSRIESDDTTHHSPLTTHQPKITDFGLAKFLAGGDLTRTGDVLGTPSYMAPEQTEGKPGGITAAADVYGLGTILFEALTGRPPFMAETAAATVIQVQQDEPVPPRRLQPTVPRDLETICLKCLHKDPARRFATAQDLADDLRRFRLGEPILTRPVGSAERALRWCRRKPVLAGLVAAVALLFGIVAIGGPVAAVRIARQRDRAEEHVRLAREELWNASLQQGRAERRSGQMGQRYTGLQALARAAALRPSLELRDEAIACLALPDLRLIRQWVANPLFESGIAFDQRLERYTTIADGVISIRQVANDRELFSVKSPGMRGLGAFPMFSPDGKFLAAQAFVTQRGLCCCIVDLEQRRTTLEAAITNNGQSSAFSPDGAWVAIALRDGALVTYETASGREVRRFERFPPVSHMAFHPTERMLAVAVWRQRNVEIRDLESGDVSATLTHASNVASLSWGGADGRVLAVGTEAGPIVLWDMASGRELAFLEGHTSNVASVFFNNAGDVLASAAWDDTTRLWDPFRARQLIVAPGFGMGFRDDGRQLAFRLGENAGVWEVSLTGACRTLVHGPGAPSRRPADYRGPWGLDYHPRGHLLASSGQDGIRLWDPRSGRERAHLPINQTDTVLFHPNGARLISFGQGGLRCWTLRSEPGDPDDGLPLGPARRLQGPANGYWHRRACCWGPGGHTLAAVANRGDTLVTVLPFETPGAPVTFKGPAAAYASVAMSSDGHWLAASPWNESRIIVWETKSGKAVKEFAGSRPGANSTNVFFSPDAQWLVVGGQREFRFFRAGSWEPGLAISRDHLENRPGHLAFTSDGKMMALTWSRQLVRLVDTATGQVLATLTSPDPQPISRLCFSPDDQQLAVATENYAVHLWDLRQLHRELAELGLDW